MSNAARTREINDTIRYTMWSVFRLATAYGADGPRDGDAAEVDRPARQARCGRRGDPRAVRR